MSGSINSYPTILEKAHIKKFHLGAVVLTGLAVLIDVAALEELCLAVLTGTSPDFVATAVGTKFLLGCR
ncbi:hypothetical protein Tco_0316496 [Tanacetum coccineum]